MLIFLVWLNLYIFIHTALDKMSDEQKEIIISALDI